MKKIIYLSHSLKEKRGNLSELRQKLSSLGFEVISYVGGNYNLGPLLSADVVLFIPKGEIDKIDRGVFEFSVGKGQFTEAKIVAPKDKGFVFHGFDDKGKILMSKLKENPNYHVERDTTSWKKNYGSVESYVMGDEPVDFQYFISGFLNDSSISERDDTDTGNKKLLLLRNN